MEALLETEVKCLFKIISGFKVWQYYLLPPEEQQMPGVINPMCYTFPRIGKKPIKLQGSIFLNIRSSYNLQVKKIKSPYIDMSE